MQDFKANVVPVESEVILPKISRSEKKTEINDQQIGRIQAKRGLIIVDSRKNVKIIDYGWVTEDLAITLTDRTT
jgi:hypothetical protein